jgi:hypothetical protein
LGVPGAAPMTLAGRDTTPTVERVRDSVLIVALIFLGGPAWPRGVGARIVDGKRDVEGGGTCALVVESSNAVGDCEWGRFKGVKGAARAGFDMVAQGRDFELVT